MKKQAIAHILRERTKGGITDFAKKIQVSRQAVYIALDGDGSRRIRVEIAKHVNMSPSVLWHDNPPRVRMMDDFDFLESFR